MNEILLQNLLSEPRFSQKDSDVNANNCSLQSSSLNEERHLLFTGFSHRVILVRKRVHTCRFHCSILAASFSVKTTQKHIHSKYGPFQKESTAAQTVYL